MTWSVLGESMIGTAHRARNIPCQDAHCFSVFGPEGECVVVAVADGAGSSAHSDVGARLVCDHLVQRVEAGPSDIALTRDDMVALLAEAREVLLTEAERLGVGPRELACTALLAVSGPTGAAFGQIGDGAIVIGEDTGFRAVFWPEPTEYANATDFLTEDRFEDSILFEAVATPISELAVLTDGLQRLALDFAARGPHPAFFQPLFAKLRTAAGQDSLAARFRSFLDSPRINDRSDDDKTLVFAVRTS